MRGKKKGMIFLEKGDIVRYKDTPCSGAECQNEGCFFTLVKVREIGIVEESFYETSDRWVKVWFPRLNLLKQLGPENLLYPEDKELEETKAELIAILL